MAVVEAVFIVHGGYLEYLSDLFGNNHFISYRTFIFSYLSILSLLLLFHVLYDHHHP